ncbi:NTP transferase domain-containing protein [Promethearchaeum syntrophicum]|uniref:NTP transferase domain-containing protein n=1 Tax=Promethearchaeum syntrophicum TaxID=2594042 RepID=A0A5B9DB54_9ARCH|nr:phosphocholine cytidylyltransferase family protein [Candidatus Prometheoarchaeum syntrophicum]QEE16067.1 UTP--glucose-1-phosphate uridylyltransferase AglF [Candidatus Prometheoarchaeum syntrophicum]
MPKQKYSNLEEIKEIYQSVKKIGYKKTSEKFNEHISLLERIVKRYEENMDVKKMKVIIIAAGMGSRLKDMTKYLPKPLLEIENGKSIIEREIETLHEVGLDDIVIIRGYQKDKFSIPNVTYYENDVYTENNILESLFCAEEAMEDGFICTYADSVFSKEIFQRILNAPEDICLGVEPNWRKRYEKRNEHPTDEAELVKIEEDKIVSISKFCNPDAYGGEFIGVAKFTKKGAEILRRNYHRARESKSCRFAEGQRFHDAVSIRKAYITDMIQELIERGYPIHPVMVNHGWVEIDTQQDYEYAQNLIKKGEL